MKARDLSDSADNLVLGGFQGDLMAGTTPPLSRGQKRALGGGILLLLAAFGSHSWLLGLIAVGLLGGVFWMVYNKTVALNKTLEPWP